jgi:hypothetical protein
METPYVHLNPQRLTWWQERLGDWEAAPTAEVGAFVPMVARGAVVAPVCVRLPTGAVVEVDSEAVPAAWVASLLRALSAASER